MTTVNPGLPFELWFSNSSETPETRFWLLNKHLKLKADTYYTYVGVQTHFFAETCLWKKCNLNMPVTGSLQM